jgi:uncharacterized protein YdaU (DUF1376 family)
MAGDLLPYFKLYPAETIADERFSGWTITERGAWLTLLLHAWVNGSIPSDEASLARILHVDATAMRSLWVAIGDRFAALDHLPDGRLSSPRLEQERDEARAKVAAGKKGAKSRWGKGKQGNATAVRPQCDRNADPMPTEQSNAEQSNATQIARAARIGVGDPAFEAVQHWTQTVWAKVSPLPCPAISTAQKRSLAELTRRHTAAVVLASMDRAAADPFWADKLDLDQFVAKFARFMPHHEATGTSKRKAMGIVGSNWEEPGF